ncbi:MAG: PD-(D/E)XK nuclease family protein, partial [Actinocatenispora sp.]
MTVDTSQPGDFPLASATGAPGGDQADAAGARGSEHPLRRHRDATPTASVLAEVRGSLSPSRAADFKTCPLLYRLRSIDRLPETPSRDQARGTLVHAVLERLFELPAADRTPAAATALLEPEWQRLQEAEPLMTTLFPGAEPTDAAPTDA